MIEQQQKETEDRRYPRTLAYLEEIGVNAGLVVDRDFTVNSYFAVQLDDDGKRIVNDKGDILIAEFAWPSLSEAIHAVDLYLQEGGGKVAQDHDAARIEHAKNDVIEIGPEEDGVYDYDNDLDMD